MSTHTDGAAPSVRSGPSARAAPSEPPHGSGDEPPAGATGAPPRPRSSEADRAEPDGPASDEDGDVRSDAGEDAPPTPLAAGAGPSWVQQEIARRIAEKGASDSGRHARQDPAGAPPAATPAPGTPPTAAPDPAPEQDGTAAPPTDEDDDDSRPPRAVPGRTGSFRVRSGWMPDPYSPDGLREPRPGDRTSADDGTGPEPPFRMAGPAARPAAAAPRDEADAPDTGTSGTAGPKQWPPADGAAGLPRRVPGAGWTLDRATLLGGAGSPARDIDTETRPVPSTWAPTGRRPAAERAGPPTAELGAAPADYDDDYDEDGATDDGDTDEGDTDDGDLRGPAVERTEVIWRAPGLDDGPEHTGSVAVAAPPDGAPSQNPYTGARPRRFAGAPTDPAPVVEEPVEEQAVADGPEGRRVRIVLSERRTTAQSVRPVVDVQDPGSVGTTLRNGLVSNQLGLAVRVFGVALLGLGLLPALFAAFPSIGELSVIGLRVPWLLLGFLVYPFLFGLGWWYVNSAERVEQDFAEGVQDR